MRAFVRKFYICFFLPMLTGACFIACKQHSSPVHDHAGYIDSVLQKSDISPADTAKLFFIADSAYHSLSNPGSGDLWEKHRFKFATHYFNTKNFPAAMVYADSMLLVLADKETDSDYVEKHAKSLFYKGDIYLAERNYAEAFNWYYKARAAITLKKDTCSFSEYTSRLATACYRQGKFLDAADYFKQALRDEAACRNNTFQSFADIQGGLDNIGIAYVKSGIKDSASLYFHKALDYIKDNEGRFPDRKDFMLMARAVIYGNLANVAIEEKKYAEAESLLEGSIKINQDPKRAPEDAVYSRIKLGKIYLAQGRLIELQKILVRIDSAQSVYHNTELTIGYYQLRSRLAAEKKDHPTAYHYLFLYDSLRDSIAAANAPITSIDVQQSLDNIGRQYQLSVLEKENRRKSDYLWLTIVIALLGIVIFILLLINYRRSKKNLKDLTDLNDTVTNRNHALQQTLTSLEHSHQNNSRFMKIVAHDLRGPIGSITSLARMARNGSIAPERYNEMLNAIYESGTKSMSLINGLLTDMEASGQLTHIVPLNVDDILKYCVELYSHQMQQKNQTVSLQTIPAVINGDQEKLWRVFSNLIANAVKFSREGGMIIVTMHQHNDNVVIAIHDHGIGIPENFKDKIFSSTAAENRKGTSGEVSYGLGLSISKQIISLHNGTIWFESIAGQGASFYVSLPLVSNDHIY